MSKSDVRTIELAESVEADFSTRRWAVEPKGQDYRVGAGLYLMVPVCTEGEAEILADLVAQWRDSLNI